MKKMLLIHHYGGISGASISLLHIVHSLNKNKYKIIVMCPRDSGEIIEALKKEKCEIIITEKSPQIFAHYNGGIERALSLKTIKNLFSILKDKIIVEKYIKDINPDIVAVNSMTLFWIGKISKSLNKETICFHRETYQKGLFGIRSMIIKKGLDKWFDKTIFISQNDYNDTPNTNMRKEIVYDKVDLTLFNNYNKKNSREKLGLDKNTKYILYLGGMSSLKGSDVIMKAMKYVKDKNIRLIFIENTDLINRKSLLNNKSISEFIKFILKKGIVNKTLKIYYNNNLDQKVIFKNKTLNPELYYKACDLIVFPSTKPHQARPIYEAGISKIPIVITDFHETEEFAKDRITAITFKNKDSKDLANKIELVLKEKIDITSIIENNYKQAIKRHDLTKLESDLDNIL